MDEREILGSIRYGGCKIIMLGCILGHNNNSNPWTCSLLAIIDYRI